MLYVQLLMDNTLFIHMNVFIGKIYDKQGKLIFCRLELSRSRRKASLLTTTLVIPFPFSIPS